MDDGLPAGERPRPSRAARRAEALARRPRPAGRRQRPLTWDDSVVICASQLSDTKTSRGGPAAAFEARWMVLVHQIPPAPAYLRVKIGRHLARIGAVAIKNSVYVLPLDDETQEDFQWILR